MRNSLHLDGFSGLISMVTYSQQKLVYLRYRPELNCFMSVERIDNTSNKLSPLNITQLPQDKDVRCDWSILHCEPQR